MLQNSNACQLCPTRHRQAWQPAASSLLICIFPQRKNRQVWQLAVSLLLDCTQLREYTSRTLVEVKAIAQHTQDRGNTSLANVTYRSHQFINSLSQTCHSLESTIP